MKNEKMEWTYLLIHPRIFSITHQLLHAFNPTNLLVDSLQNLRALLQAKQYILLHQSKLDLPGQLLQLGKLGIGFCQQAILIFLAAQREKRPVAVISREALLCDGCFAVGEYGDALLVLV